MRASPGGLPLFLAFVLASESTLHAGPAALPVATSPVPLLSLTGNADSVKPIFSAEVQIRHLALPTGVSIVSNPLDAGSNRIAGVLSIVPDGTLLFKFDPNRQVYADNQFAFGAWAVPDQPLAPGEAAFLVNRGPPTNLVLRGVTPSSASALPILHGGFNLISLWGRGNRALPVPLEGDTLHVLEGAGYRAFAYEFGEWFPTLPDLASLPGFFYQREQPLHPNAQQAAGAV